MRTGLVRVSASLDRLKAARGGNAGQDANALGNGETFEFRIRPTRRWEATGIDGRVRIERIIDDWEAQVLKKKYIKNTEKLLSR